MGFLDKIKREVTRVVDQVVDFVDDTIDWFDSLFNPEDEPSSLTVNKSSATASIPKPYGKRKIGGTRVYLSTNGSKNKYLSSVLIQCVGPVHSSSSVTISDKAESEFGGKLRHTFYHGYPDQAADANFVSELAEWTTDHRLQGIAYEAIRYTYDQDLYSGLPVFTSIIEGGLLYDPRDETTSYSDNFALVVLDYFRSTEYGVGMSDKLIDFDSFKTSADVADISYPSNSDSDVLVKRFACNTVIDTSQTPFDNIKTLVSESRAFLTQTAGQWRYIIQNDSTADHTITYDDIIGDITRSPNGAQDKYNRVTVSYVDPDTEWDSNEATYPIDDDEYQAYLEEDNWEESHQDVTVNSCTNRYQALDIARQILLESRVGGVISFTAQPWMIKVRCGDLLVMDIDGLNDGVLWRVSSRSLPADGEVSFTCSAYDPTIFNWIDIPEQTTVIAPTVADASILPAPESVVYLSNEWSEATVGSLSWTQSDSAFVHDYLVEVYRSSDGIQVLSTTFASSSDWADEYMPTLNLPYLAAGEYDATVRARNALTRSSVTTATFSVDVPEVGKITGLATVGEFDSSLSLSWNALDDSSLKHYQVEIYDVMNGVSLATVNSSTESVTISFETFYAIGLPRSFEVRVCGVNSSGERGELSAIAVSKPAPTAPAIQLWSSVNDVKLTLSAAANAKGVTVWLGNSDSVENIDSNQRYKGESLSITIDNLEALTKYQIAIASYDAFGFGSASTHSFTTLKDAVADSIQQLTERDLSLSESIEIVAQDLVEKNAIQSANTETVSEEVLNAAADAAEIRRLQLAQNDEYYRILNAVVEIDAETGTITNRAYEYTNTKFSEASLLIDGVNSSVALQAKRIETAEDSIESVESELLVQSGLISQRATYTQLTETVANAISAIQPAYSTNFNTGLDGWSAQSGTAVYNASAWVDITLGDVVSDMDYVGSENPVIQLTIARESGAAWVGKIQYKTASHGYSSSYELDIPDVVDDGLLYTVVVDFGEQADYVASAITGLRIILGSSVSDVYQLHGVQAGKRTAAQVALESLQGRVSTAESSIDAINGSLTNYVTTTFFEANSLTQNDVQQTLDSWNAQYSIIAKLTEFDENGTLEKANSAEQWIDGAEAFIQQIAQSTAQDEFGSRISEVEQTLDAQNGTISQQITSIHKAEIATESLAEEALLNAAEVAAAKREQTAQSDTIALSRSETKAVADELSAEATRVDQLFVQYAEENQALIQQESTARADADEAIAKTVESLQSEYNDNKSTVQQSLSTLANADSGFAQSIQSLSTTVGENKAEVDEYKRTAIGYCVDANGNPTSHETAVACELVGNTWQGETSIAEALRNVTVTGKNAEGEDVEVSAGAMYQAILDTNGTATATAAVLAVYGNQLAGIFANAGEDGSSLEFLADNMKFKTENGTKTPFYVEGDDVFINQASIKDLLISKLKSEDGSLVFEDGKLKADFIDADNLEVDFAKLKNVSIKTGDIEDGAINSAKIGTVIQSENFVSGSKGWRIKKDGSAEFNGVVLSREMVLAQGEFNFGTVSCGNSSGISKVYETIVDTGYTGSSWVGTKYYTTVNAGFVSGSNNTSVNANASTLSQAAWGLTAEVVPITRWNASYGGSTIHLRIKIYARRLNYIDNTTVSWRLLRVS